MPSINMPVAQRIVLLTKIFAEFGIEVAANSPLDQAIRNEFGPGKRSKLNQILQAYTQQTDAAALSICIGTELQAVGTDPKLCHVGRIMCERLPNLLEILDIRGQTTKREQMLGQILAHFTAKLASHADTDADRLLRMLDATQRQLHTQLQAQAVGTVVADLGAVFACRDLERCGTVLRVVLPVLINLEDATYTATQRVNCITHALRTLAMELPMLRLEKAADLIDYAHWLAQINLPSLSNPTTIEQILQKLDVPLGASTARMLRDKARSVGLHDQELLEILASNQKHAATCSVIAKFGRELACPELEKIGVVGLCGLTLRQSFHELRTANLNSVNFSESLGIMLSGLGTLTNNNTLSKLGMAVSNGVKAYAGLMVAPGGATVALPLAVCTVLAGILIKHKPKQHTEINKVVRQTVIDIQEIQRAMSWHFAELHNSMTAQQREVIRIVDRGFASLSEIVGNWHLAHTQTWRKLEDIQESISNEFIDLYLEYIRDPLDQLRFYDNYDQYDAAAIPKIKLKLNMWLLYKAKHSKVNGVLQDPVALHTAARQPAAKLGLINRYLNQEFSQQLREDFPHVPTWLLAADAYIELLPRYQDLRESHILQDIITLGSELHAYLLDLTANAPLRQRLAAGMDLLEQEQQNIISQLQPRVPVREVARCAKPAPWEYQLEKFTALPWDLSAIWEGYRLNDELLVAQHYQLGTIYAQYVVERSNTFTEVHVPCSQDPLPNNAGQIKFKVEILFKHNDQAQSYLLATSQHQYLLANGYERFTQYYQQKFRGSFKHRNYLWISLDGMQNQVVGHPVTNTQKPIDYTRLAQLYAYWFRNSTLLDVQLYDNQALRMQIQSQISVCQEREQQTFSNAQAMHQRLQEVREKLKLYQALDTAIHQLCSGELASRIEYTVARLRLLLATCRDIMPTL